MEKLEIVDFNDLPEHLKQEFRYAVKSDQYGLKPETLYKNCVGSLIGASGSQWVRVVQVTKIMEMPFTPINDIYEINKIGERL